MTTHAKQPSLRTAALIAGLALLLMAIAAPFAELYVWPRLVVTTDAAASARNILANQSLFRMGILGYFTTFVLDIVAAWALYVLLRPVDRDLSLLTAWFRLVYAVVALALLPNLLMALRLLSNPDYATVFGPDQLHTQAALLLSAFKRGWSFSISLFGIHLGLLGWLILRSTYIPRVLGVLVMIAGLGYLVTGLQPAAFPGMSLHLARYTFYGELIFMLWLLIGGARIEAPTGAPLE